MMSATSKLANPQCGPAVLHVARIEASFSSSPPKSTSFTRRSTWNLQNLNHRREMKAFQFRVGRKAHQQATASVIRNMSSGDTQNGEEYHQVQLIDANPSMMVGNNVFISDDNGQETKVEFMPDYSARDKCVRFGDIGTSSMYLQSLNAPACVLAVTTAEQIADKFKDHSKLHQFLYKAITEEDEQIKLTGVWLSKGANGEYKLRCGVYFDSVKRECKLDMSIRMLKIALMYDIPIFVHRDLLRHKRPILGRNVLESRRTVFSQ